MFQEQWYKIFKQEEEEIQKLRETYHEPHTYTRVRSEERRV